MHIGLVAMHCGCSAEFFSYACFNYPTLGDLYKYAAYDAMVKRMMTSPTAAADGRNAGSATPTV